MKKSTAIIAIIAACLIMIVKSIIVYYALVLGVTYSGAMLCVSLLHQNDKKIGNYTVEEGSRGYQIKYYSGAGGDVVIPSTLNGLKVVSIATGYAGNVFGDCENFTSVTIPDTVTCIGKFAFRDCGELTSVEIPDSVTRIDFDAFYRCTSLTNVTLGSNVTEIGSAFRKCTSLKSINIPESVTKISDSTFEGCESIQVTYMDETFDYEHLDGLYNAINHKIEPPPPQRGLFEEKVRTCPHSSKCSDFEANISQNGRIMPAAKR